MAYKICDDASVAADGTTSHFPIEDSEGNIRLHDYEQITIVIDMNVGTGSESIVFDADVAVEEGGTWFGTTVNDLTSTGASKEIQTDSITITSDTTEAIVAMRNPAPHVRLNITNNGDNGVRLTAWAIIA